MAFSGALTLTDLNDFITPSQACIKPVEQLDAPENMSDAGSASTEIRIDSSGSYYEVLSNPSVHGATPSERRLKQAQISLNDCLACRHWVHHVGRIGLDHSTVPHGGAQLPRGKPTCKFIGAQGSGIVDRAPMSGVALGDVVIKLKWTCRTETGDAASGGVLHTGIGTLNHAREFWERKRGGNLPMLASACPGWICYAEKTHSEMLPFISRTKSPQQVMGTLVKSWLASTWGKQPDQIYHVTVMPCYDKKLEASRQDFYDEVYSTRDVDCVITTGELELLMDEKGWDLSDPVPGEDDARNLEDIPELLLHPGTSSGSYLHSLMSAVRHASPEPLCFGVKTVRTSDYEEYTLSKQSDGEVVFKGAKCYGFRNLQNVVRKVGKEAGVQVGRGAAGRMVGIRARAKKSGAEGDEKRYDFVEVMACPGGCVNGGGQLRPIGRASERTDDGEGYVRNWEEHGVSMSAGGDEMNGVVGSQGPRWGNREWTNEVEKAYWHKLPTAASDYADHIALGVQVDMCRPEDVARTRWDADMDNGAEERRRELFRTNYRAVESQVKLARVLSSFFSINSPPPPPTERGFGDGFGAQKAPYPSLIALPRSLSTLVQPRSVQELDDPLLGYVLPLSSFTSSCSSLSISNTSNSACPPLCHIGPNRPDPKEPWIALVQRGHCPFVDKEGLLSSHITPPPLNIQIRSEKPNVSVQEPSS
ncbi:iron hydrogenase [Lanmaoa asiatica]|nr:iron hydrogenase [Lanmaoa asiatica]